MRASSSAALLVLACSTPLAQLKQELGPRAALELSCPESDLRFKELEHVISTTKVSVTGCQRAATYHLVESQWRLLDSK